MRRLALDNHEFLAGRLAVRFLDLDGDQKKLFQKQLSEWSSRVSMVQVDSIADKIEELGKTSDPETVAWRVQVFVREMMVDACRDFSPVLASLSNEQIDHLRAKIAERNEKHDPDANGGLDRYRKTKREEQIQNTELWLGSISDAQKMELASLDQLKDPEGKWEAGYLEYSREAQGAFLAMLLRFRGDIEGMGKSCAGYARDPDAVLSEASRKSKSAVTDFRRRSIAMIFASIDTDQRKHLERETAKLAADLRAWAKRVRDEALAFRPAR